MRFNKQELDNHIVLNGKDETNYCGGSYPNGHKYTYEEDGEWCYNTGTDAYKY